MKIVGGRARRLRAIGTRTLLVASVVVLVGPVVASAEPGPPAPAPPGPIMPPPPMPPAFFPPVTGYSASGHAGGHGDTSTVPANGKPQFLAAAKPIHVFVERLHILGVQKIDAFASIPLAGGRRSPSDTVYMRLREATVDNLTATQDVNGRSITIHNTSNHDQNLLIRLGNAKSTIDVWTVVNSAKICVTVETLNTIVTTYKGLFGGRLDEVLALIATTFEPYLTGPLKRVGPCLPIKEFVPLAAVLVDAGVPLPDDIPAEKVDLNVYSAHVTSDPSLLSAKAPALTLAVN